jgi:THO complex subunit 4
LPQELFSTCGTVARSFIHYDVSGRSEGSATVVFEDRASAVDAIKQFNGVQLDNTTLKIEFAPVDEPQAPSSLNVRLSSGRR